MLSWSKNVNRFGSEWRFALRLWDGLGEKGRPVIIIPCDVENLEDPATGAGECRSAALISVCCGALGVKDLRIVYPHELLNEPKPGPKEKFGFRDKLENELGGSDVILLGSGLANSVTAVALELLRANEPSLDVGWGRSKESQNHFIQFGGPVFETNYLEPTARTPHSMTFDFGFFLVRPNCFDKTGTSGGRIFIFSGAHTYGTQATAELLFSPQGAGKIAERFQNEKGERQQSWRRKLSGVIRVSSVKMEAGKPAMEQRLTRRERDIEVLAPTEISGIEIKNPLMSPTLNKFHDYSNYGQWRTLGFEILGFLSVLLACAGVYLHQFALVAAAISFYVVERIIHRKDE